MTFSTVKKISAFLLFTVTVFSYQNCGKGFTTAGLDEIGGVTLSSSTSPENHTYHIMSSSTAMEVNKDIEFELHAEALTGALAYSWIHKLSGVPNACKVVNNSSSTNYIVNCPTAGELTVSLTIYQGNATLPLANYVVADSAPTAASTTPANSNMSDSINLTVNFTIPSGTGSNPWNTSATIVETFVGQTLRINNADTQVHQLHTGGRPCPHGSPIAAGATGTCVISMSYDSQVNGIVYDHNLGTKATFSLVAYDGNTLYANRCANCHGALANSEVKLAKISAIKNAINNVGAMKNDANLMKLTQRQLEAISYALGAR